MYETSNIKKAGRLQRGKGRDLQKKRDRHQVDEGVMGRSQRGKNRTNSDKGDRRGARGKNARKKNQETVRDGRLKRKREKGEKKARADGSHYRRREETILTGKNM